MIPKDNAQIWFITIHGVELRLMMVNDGCYGLIVAASKDG